MHHPSQVEKPSESQIIEFKKQDSDGNFEDSSEGSDEDPSSEMQQSKEVKNL